MCDDITENENGVVDGGHWLLGQRLARRDIGLIASGAAMAAMLPGCATAQPGSSDGANLRTTSARVSFATPDGTADGFFVHPARGRHPAVLLWPDIAGSRPAYEAMATRLAAAGYAVLVMNQYYRSQPAPVLASFAEWRSPEGQARLRPMIAAITPDGTMRDAVAAIGWLDAQPQVDTRAKVGSIGYCMGGPHTFRTAAAVPTRVGAIGSFHGGGLVTAAADSPHLLLPRMQAALLVAVAQNDDARAPADKDTLRAAATAAGRPAEIEVYPAQHGWCTIDAPIYDREQAERAWARMLALFGERLPA